MAAEIGQKHGFFKNKLNKFSDTYLKSDVFALPQLKNIIIPILIDQALVAFLSIFNSAMISSSGAEAVAAVNMVDSINFFLMNFYIAVATGGTVVTAQYMGRGNKEKAGETIGQTVLASLLISVVVGIVMIIFSKQVLGLLFSQADEKVFSYGVTYLIGSCISYPFYSVFQAVASTVRGVGYTKASMYISIFMNVIYVIGNFILVKYMHMGIYGLVISLIFARALASVICFIYIHSIRKQLFLKIKNFFVIKFSLQKSIMYIGIPSAAEQLFFNGGKLITQYLVVSLGTVSLTANAVGGSITNLFLIIGNSLSIAIVTVVGQCIGASRFDEARKMIKLFNIASVVSCIISIVVIAPFVPLMLNMFGLGEEINKKIIVIIIIFSAGLPTIYHFSFITPSGLRAAGDAFYTSVMALFTMWTFRVGLSWLFVKIMGLGVEFVWLAMVLEWCVRGLLFHIRYKGDKWFNHKII